MRHGEAGDATVSQGATPAGPETRIGTVVLVLRLAMATAVARWTIANMQDPSGYFYYRRYPFMVARTPMLHWGQATMYRALAYLSLRQRVDG